MQIRIVLLASCMALGTGCRDVECGDGTTERDGSCVPSTETIGAAQCGPFTELRGDRCAPMLPPTVCDPATTQAEVDDLGVTTCIGTGAGGCAARLACPAPANGTQTICGQLYDFENNTPFAAANAMGTACAAGATGGPCAVGIRAYDALAFAQNPGTTPPLPVSALYIDDCGRYKLTEVAQPASGVIALGIDDAMAGPGGITNAVGLATSAAPNTATRDFDGFVVPGPTTAAWATSGGPTIASGYYVPVFRGRRAGSALAAGVTVTYGPMTTPPPASTDTNRDFYFALDAAPRTSLSAAASATGVNGTALFSGANLAELYSGQGGLPAECRWDLHAGASTPGVVFIQIFRPINNGAAATCNL